MTTTAAGDDAPTPPRSSRSAFSGPVKWFLVECNHYAVGPARGRVRAGDSLFCVVCSETRRAVKPAE